MLFCNLFCQFKCYAYFPMTAYLHHFFKSFTEIWYIDLSVQTFFNEVVKFMHKTLSIYYIISKTNVFASFIALLFFQYYLR